MKATTRKHTLKPVCTYIVDVSLSPNLPQNVKSEHLHLAQKLKMCT